MYKGISRFLSRLKTTVEDFASFVRWRSPKPRSIEPSSAAQAGLVRDVPQRQRDGHATFKTPDVGRSFSPGPNLIAEDGLAWVEFTTEHRLALRIGESSHAGHAFVRETAKAIHDILDFQSLTCGEIAQQLNRVKSATPRSGKWNSILVYHFTRHYMEVRPPF